MIATQQTTDHLVTLDPGRQQSAREYARIRRRLLLLDLAISVAYMLLWLFSGLSVGLRQAVSNITGNEWLIVASYGLLFGGLYGLVNLPLAYYSGFVLPHRYELGTQTLGGWLADQVKGAALAAVIGGGAGELVYFGLRVAPTSWWLWATLGYLLFTVVLANLAPTLLLPLFFKLTPLDNPDLTARLERLAAQAGVKVRGVYRMDLSSRTRAANAMVTGLGNTHRIVIGDTLLNEFTPDEIETVMAHELGHYVHHDIWLGVLSSTLAAFVGFYLASVALAWGMGAFGLYAVSDVAGLPLLGLIAIAFGLVTMPITNGVSRWAEARADKYALKVTHLPQAFADAMTRLANQNLGEVDPEPWVEFLLYDHPPIGKRVAMARDFGSQPDSASGLGSAEKRRNGCRGAWHTP
jgi:STE24 endopeptidase